MNNSLILKKISTIHPLLSRENFCRAKSGTVHEVYLSEKYAVRIRKNNPDILIRESYLLKSIKHSLIPSVLYEGSINDIYFAVENRLPGVTIDSIWKDLAMPAKKAIISDIISFLKYLRSQKGRLINSVKTGRKYQNFYEYLTDDIDNISKRIYEHEDARDMLHQLLDIIKKDNSVSYFNDSEITLVHGDLVFHNLLTDGENLTGVLDWELSFYGDPDYDIFRLMNFKHSAKIYLDQGCDDDFEFDYLDQLLDNIFHSSVISTKENRFKEKYKIAMASYYLNALAWAVSSNNAQENVVDVASQWQKSSEYL